LTVLGLISGSSLRFTSFPKHPVRLPGPTQRRIRRKTSSSFAGGEAAGTWTWPLNSILWPSHESCELCVCRHDFHGYNLSFAFTRISATQ